jgi:hypothetical protein
MHTRDFLLLAYDAFSGEIHGKTNLQKKVYFLGLMVGQDLGYDPHFYGPYSAEVADANSELKSLGYIEESVAGVGDSDAFGFEIARHDYKLNDAGRILVRMKKAALSEEWQKIKGAAENIQRAGEIGYMNLSVAAKAHYIISEHSRKPTVEEVKQIASKFGWTIGEPDLRKAVDFLTQVGLVPSSSK